MIMSQVQRLVVSSMDTSAGENGELLSLNDYEHDDDHVGSGKKKARNPNCCERFLKCLSHVPCASLIAWIILLLGLGGLTGSLLIGSRKTRDLLNNQPLLWFMDFTLIGVIVSMFVLGTVFLIIGHISSEPTSRRVFNSSSKNRCARGLNMGFLSFVYFLTVCWILASALLFIPLVMLGILYYVTEYDGLTSLNLKYYGFEDRHLDGETLDEFMMQAKDVLICYSCAYVSSLLVVISMIHFLISITANITHLTDNRFAALNAYEPGEEMRNSKHSVLDTNM
ncbi:uncharacterized protein LOC126831174 isoform X2 [Patella vulgata]|uniref:uncharacterized protein LOC126831174 isoform X2 n=1 Tax=Patella vulgata TaxID=6465 RepID=UPI00217F28DB|nr:uncharacterized protein LOC126831174 isoform X2 [Patella vulgata]